MANTSKLVMSKMHMYSCFYLWHMSSLLCQQKLFAHNYSKTLCISSFIMDSCTLFSTWITIMRTEFELELDELISICHLLLVASLIVDVYLSLHCSWVLEENSNSSRKLSLNCVDGFVA